MRGVFISDTHGQHRGMTHPIPDGDLLGHTGDCLKRGSLEELRNFCEWFAEQPHRYKILLAGNHDRCFEDREASARDIVSDHGITYLQDSSITFAGKVFYGAPWTPIFYDWSFMRARGETIRIKWNQIPSDVDVLLTHGPPYGHGDLVPPYAIPLSSPRKMTQPRHAGCLELLKRIQEVQPSYHVCGHIHAGYGVTRSDELPMTTFVNAAICNEAYAPVNAPQVIEI